MSSHMPPGAFPMIESVPIAPPRNRSAIAVLMSTSDSKFSWKHDTDSTASPVVQSRMSSRCEPESLSCPPPESASDCRHLPCVPRYQF